MKVTAATLFRCVLFLTAANVSAADAPDGAAPQVIFDMDSVRHRPGEFTRDKEKVKAGTADVVDGKVGKAVRFAFVEGASGGFMTGAVRATEAWDAAEGFSFWVKGDGSRTWGGIELIDRDDFSLRYGYCFPIDSAEWRKVVVPWGDLVPELAGPPVGTGEGMYRPGGFGHFFFGKWFYWRDYPAQSYAIDHVVLEAKIPADDQAAVARAHRGVERLRAKLRERKPVTIVTMGDSLTDERHWANRQAVWHKLLADAIKAKYGGDVRVINPAIGGTTLSQNMVLMPRWGAEAPAPDLVTVWFGGNDWEAGVRGPRFKQYLRLAVDRIRRQTRGGADIVLMTTCPSHGGWEKTAELEQAVREVAEEQGVGLADVAALFRRAGSPDAALKADLWAWDKVHLGDRGHETARDAVLNAIDAKQP